MEGSGKKRLARLLHRLRGDHHKCPVDKASSLYSTSAMSESTGCGSTFEEDDFLQDPPTTPTHTSQTPSGACSETIPLSDNDKSPPNIDLRYAGQYLTVEQLPGFCDQLHQLVDIIRNIQSYAHVTGEYPAELEQRLEREAREVCALEAETCNARDVIARTRLQRRALHEHRKQLQEQLITLKDTEMRELENTVRMSDRKLYKSWEALKDSNDAAAFDNLIEEARNKQNALECLLRLIDGRRSAILKPSSTLQPLPPPMPKTSNDGLRGISADSSTLSNGVRKRHERRAAKRRRNKEPRSVPLSSEPSTHSHLPQVTLYIQGSDTAGTRRAGSVSVTPLDLPSGGSVRDILFFTTNTG